MCDAGGARRGQPAEVPPPDALARPPAALGHGVAKQRSVGGKLGGEDDLSNVQGEELGQVFRSADEVKTLLHVVSLPRSLASTLADDARRDKRSHESIRSCRVIGRPQPHANSYTRIQDFSTWRSNILSRGYSSFILFDKPHSFHTFVPDICLWHIL